MDYVNDQKDYIIDNDGAVYAQDELGNVQPYWTADEFSEILNGGDPPVVGVGTTSNSKEEDIMDERSVLLEHNLPGKPLSRLRSMIIKAGDAGLAAEYTEWYRKGGAAYPGTAKWAAGEALYRKAEAVVAGTTVNTEEESTMTETFASNMANALDGGAAGSTTPVELEVIDVEVGEDGELRDVGELDVEEERKATSRTSARRNTWGGAPSKRVWFELQTYGKLHERIADAMGRVPPSKQGDSIEIEGLLNSFHILWNEDYYRGKCHIPSWSSIMRSAEEFIAAHPTDAELAKARRDDRKDRRKETLSSVSSTLREGLGTLIDVVGGSIERVADATVDLGAQLTERAGRDMGKVISSGMRGASIGTTLVHDTHMELYIERHGSEERNALRSTYNELRGAVQMGRFQRRVLRKASRKAISAASALDAVEGGTL